jgi:hypothetical protein
MGLWLNLKREKTCVQIYHLGALVATVRVDQQNRGNNVVVNLEGPSTVSFKLTREEEIRAEKNELENFNQ